MTSIKPHRPWIVACLLVFGCATACGGIDGSNGDDNSGWTLPEDDTGVPDTDPDPDTGPDPDTTPPPPDTTPPPPDADICPDAVMKRDGRCEQRCSQVDPDCHDQSCPNPDDPKVSYVADSWNDPKICRLADFVCDDGERGFSKRLCGCGCIEEDDTAECPDPNDPDVRYVSRETAVCKHIKFSCKDGRKPFSNECGCGCVGDASNSEYCAPQDADGRGACRQLLGYRFDGTQCEALSGCRCEGSECDELFMGKSACERQYRACTKDTCSPHPLSVSSGPGSSGNLGGVGDDICAGYFAWNGSACTRVPKCQGSCKNNPQPDCQGLYTSQKACASDHSQCGDSDPGICGGMDARGRGGCTAVLGYKYDGSQCLAISGCSCEGSDCHDLFKSRSACRTAAGKCGGSGSTCSARRACSSGSYCDYPNNSCGFDDGTGTCKTQSVGCPEYYAPVCGCDGQTYSNGCIAHANGTDIQHTGKCGN